MSESVFRDPMWGSAYRCMLDEYSGIPTWNELKKSQREELTQVQIEYVRSMLINGASENKSIDFRLEHFSKGQLKTLGDVLSKKGYVVTFIHGSSDFQLLNVNLTKSLK